MERKYPLVLYLHDSNSSSFTMSEYTTIFVPRLLSVLPYLVESCRKCKKDEFL